MKNKQYTSLSLARIDVQAQSPILATSIIDNATIMASGQEIGRTYDLSNDATGESGKHFNHEWE